MGRGAPRNRLSRLLVGGAAAAAGIAVARKRVATGSFVTRGRLRAALEPRPGERLLEVEPGSGHFTERVAEWLWPAGRLDLVAAEEAELERAAARLRDLGLDNVAPAAAGATLPWPDETFDGAFSVGAAGTLLRRPGMFEELHRVIRPGGRLVLADRSLGAAARAAGFEPGRGGLLLRFERR